MAEADALHAAGVGGAGVWGLGLAFAVGGLGAGGDREATLFFGAMAWALYKCLHIHVYAHACVHM